jgi:hypothetical protein
MVGTPFGVLVGFIIAYYIRKIKVFEKIQHKVSIWTKERAFTYVTALLFDQGLTPVPCEAYGSAW